MLSSQKINMKLLNSQTLQPHNSGCVIWQDQWKDYCRYHWQRSSNEAKLLDNDETDTTTKGSQNHSAGSQFNLFRTVPSRQQGLVKVGIGSALSSTGLSHASFCRAGNRSQLAHGHQRLSGCPSISPEGEPLCCTGFFRSQSAVRASFLFFFSFCQCWHHMFLSCRKKSKPFHRTVLDGLYCCRCKIGAPEMWLSEPKTITFGAAVVECRAGKFSLFTCATICILLLNVCRLGKIELLFPSILMTCSRILKFSVARLRVRKMFKIAFLKI